MTKRPAPNLTTKLLAFLVIFFTVVLLCPGVTQAVDPANIITYQGRLLNANSVPVADTALDIEFRFYDSLTGGTCLWSNSSTTCDDSVARAVNLTAGLFTENLGDTAATYATITDSIFSDDNSVYLEVEIENEILTPRKRITAVAYAINSQSLDGLDSADFLQTDNNFSDLTDASDARDNLGLGALAVLDSVNVSDIGLIAGTNITLDGSTLNVDDAFLLNNGDTGTGIFDFSGAVFSGSSPLIFEGNTSNNFETTFSITDPTVDNVITFQNASGTVAYLTDALLVANNLNDLTDTVIARQNLEIEIGVDVQAYDAGLTDIAGLSVADGNFVVGNGTNWVVESGATARTSLGLGTLASLNSVDISDNTNLVAGTNITLDGDTLNIDASLTGISSISNTGAALALSTTDSNNITLTPGNATNLINILSGSLKIGDGVPTTTLDGEDVYIEGNLEVDGTVLFDGAQTFNSDINYNFVTNITDSENLNISQIHETDTSLSTIDLVFTDTAGSNTGDNYLLKLTNADDGGNTGSPDALIYLNQADTSEVVSYGIFFNVAGGGLTDAINISDDQIINAINVGPNNIIGTNGLITYSESTTISTTNEGLNLTSHDIDDDGGGTIFLEADDSIGLTSLSSNISINTTDTAGTGIYLNAYNSDHNETGFIDINFGSGNLDITGISPSADFLLDADLLSIDGTGTSNISINGAIGEDFTISQIGGADASLILSSTGTGDDALQISTSAGGIDITATTSTDNEDVDISTIGANFGDIDLTSGDDVNISAVDNLTIDSDFFDVDASGDITMLGGDIVGANGDSFDIAEVADSQFTLQLNSDTTAVLKVSDTTDANTPFTITSAGTGTLTLDTGGAGAIQIGSGDVTTITLLTDNTGDGSDISLPTGSIDSTEILNGTIAAADLATDISVTTTGLANFNGGIAVDTDNFTVSGTTGIMSILSSATSGNLASISTDADTTILGSINGLAIDLSPITAGNFTKIGLNITGDDSGTADSFGVSMAGTVDYGIDFDGATINTSDIRLENFNTITNATAGTVIIDVTTFQLAAGSTISSSAAGTIALQSNGANTITVDTGGAASVNLGNTNANAVAIGNSGNTETITILTNDNATNDIQITGGTTFNSDTTWNLAGPEILTITNTTATAEVVDLTVTATDNDAQEINFTLGNDDNIDLLAALNLEVTTTDTGNADGLYGLQINLTNAAVANVTETAIFISGGWENAINAGSGEFIVNGGTGSITINDGGDLGQISIESTIFDKNSLDFTADGTITTGSGQDLSFTAGGNGDYIFNLDGESPALFNISGSTLPSVFLKLSYPNATNVNDGTTTKGLFIDLGSNVTLLGSSNQTGISLNMNNGGVTGTTTGIAFSGSPDVELDLSGRETISNTTSGTIKFNGAGGTNNTSLFLDLDGATTSVPTLYAGHNDLININDGLSIGVDGNTADDMTDLSFSLTGGDDLYIKDDLGVHGTSFFDDSLNLPDNVQIILGNTDDAFIYWDNASEGLVVDNISLTGSTIIRLGTDSGATDFQIQNNSEAAILTVDGSGTATFYDDFNLTTESGELIIVNKSFTNNTTEKGFNMTFAGSDTGGLTTAQYGLYLDNSGGTQALDSLLVLDNSEAAQSINTGLSITGVDDSSFDTGLLVADATTNGILVDIDGLAASAFTGTMMNLDFDQTYTGSSTNNTGKSFNITRDITMNDATNTQTLTVSGDLFSVTNNGTQTPGLGTLTETARLMFLDQNYAASTGSVFEIENASTASGLLIDQDGNGLGLEITSTATSASLAKFSAANTSGNIVEISYPSATSVTGQVVGSFINLNTNVNLQSTGSLIGQSISLPGITSSTDDSISISGVSITGLASLTQQTLEGEINWTGLLTTVPNITQTTGGITGHGIRINNGSITTGGEIIGLKVQTSTITTAGVQAGVWISPIGIGAGTLYGLEIDTINSPGAGNEVAINIGDGWNDAINVNSGAFVVETNGATDIDTSLTIDAPSTPSTERLCSTFVRVAGGDAVTLDDVMIVDCSDAGQADYAEMYPVATGVTFGDIVVPGTNSVITEKGETIVQMVKSSSAYQNVFGGVVVNNYEDGTSAGYNIADVDNPMPISLVGRVPVNVTNEGGSIIVGDPITTSSTAGFGMKATEPGMIIGYALNNFSAISGQVMVFVHSGWYAGNVLETDGSSSIFSDTLIMNSLNTASVGEPGVASQIFALRGSGWDGASAQNLDMKIQTSVTDSDNYRLSVKNTLNTEVAYITNEGTLNLTGDLILSGHLYPSDRGTAQTSKYIFYDGSEGAGGDMMRTNASGWSTGSYDFAEMFPSDELLEAGDVVAFTGANEKIGRTNLTYNQKIAGIISTRPGFLAGENQAGHFPVALAGRVPTKVNLEGGSIAVGDPLTTSSTAGYAMKATKSGMVIGYALEPFSGTESSNKIITFVNINYFNGEKTTTIPGITNTASLLTTGTSTNLTSLNLEGGLYMGGNDVLNIRRLVGLGERWSIEEDGTIKTAATIKTTITSYQNEKIETTAVTSSGGVFITLVGTAELENGEAIVIFENLDPNFNDITSTTAPIRIIVTPNGPVSLYISEKNNNGFMIKQIGGSNSDISVDWLATAYRKDYEPVVTGDLENGDVLEAGEDLEFMTPEESQTLTAPPAIQAFPAPENTEEPASSESPTLSNDPTVENEGGFETEPFSTN